MKITAFTVRLTKRQAAQIKQEWEKSATEGSATFAQIRQGITDWCNLRVVIYDPKAAEIIDRAINKANK